MHKIRFMPREEKFFDLFDQVAQVLVDAATILYELVTDYENIDSKLRELREMEKQIDDVTAGILERLNISFVTPIDREDIHSLAARLDDILDYIEASADRMKLYKIIKPREEAIELTSTLVQMTKLVKEGIHALATFRDIDTILKPCIEINKLENHADRILRDALKRLFKEETLPLEIAKWQEIFERMELATDKCEDVANVLESIVVKNA